MTVHPPPRRRRIFGIRNCDTMKKAFAWLVGHGVVVDFVDYRKAGIGIDLRTDGPAALGLIVAESLDAPTCTSATTFF